MTLQQKRERLRDIAFHLYRTEPNPFILLMPTDGFLDPDVRQVFSEKKSRLFALGNVLGVDDKTTLVPTPAAADMLAAFHADVFINANSRNRFPTPPDAQWSDIKIRFLNRDTVSIQCQGIVRTATYMDMGMVDTRSGRPTEQWLLLNNMADAHGHIGTHSTHAKQENKKRKQNLIKALRSYFGISEDPMPWNEEASAYITRFALEP